MTRFQRIALAFSLCCAVLLAVGAVTLINLTTQVSGTLPAANGGTGNTANGTNGQVLIGDGSGHFTPQDPIISRNYATLITTLGATATQNGTSRVSTLSAFGTLYVTFASITGSPASCTLQLANVDNLGNSINNGSTIALTVTNGTTTFAVTPAAALQTTDQIKATYNCGTFPTAGTITVVFSPGETTGIMFLPALPTGTNSIGSIANFPATADTNTGNASASTLRMVLATNQPNVPINLAQVGGNAVASDSNGRQILKTYPDTTTTSYRASKKFAASSTTDNAVMPGNATNTVLVTKILLTCNETTAGQINVELLKRSTADTAGTSAAMTAVPMDANYAAAVSAPLSYTGTGPTVGTAIGDLDNLQIGCMAAATATPNDIFIFHPDKPIILRGTAQQIAVNVGNAALTGGNITVTFEWMETTTP